MSTSDYLRYLAGQVRLLIACGKAAHVTAETAAELELLAAIPWDPDIDMGDIAYGWLLAARCEAHKNGALMIPDLRLTDAGWVDRAARCAELAVIAANAPSVCSGPYGSSRGRAKIAWAFICGNLPDHPVRAQYRRELDAM